MARNDSTRKTAEAVIARLKAISGMSSIWGNDPARIYYGKAPQKTAYPYVVLRILSTPLDTKTSTGYEHRLRLQAYAQQSSTRTATDLALACREAIVDSLDRASFAVTGATMIDCFQTGLSDLFDEPDGETVQSVAEFLARVGN